VTGIPRSIVGPNQDGEPLWLSRVRLRLTVKQNSHTPTQPLNHSTTLPLNHHFIQSSNHPSIQASKHPSIQSSKHPIIQSSNHPIIQSSTHPLIHSSKHPIIQSSNHPIIQSSNHPIIQSSKHPSIQASTHPSIQASKHPLSGAVGGRGGADPLGPLNRSSGNDWHGEFWSGKGRLDELSVVRKCFPIAGLAGLWMPAGPQTRPG